jgi:oxygen-independent coproporphyrinogen-3 oxidase
LERDHSAADIGQAVTLAQCTRLVVACDLIFGTPGETIEQWQSDLDGLVSLVPEHVSTYGLTFERGTAFESRRLRGELIPIHEDRERIMYETAIDFLTSGGWEHYEVSNFARPGFRSRHNQVYWSGDPYWAAGPGAARFVGGIREVNHRSTSTYIKRVLAGQSHKHGLESFWSLGCEESQEFAEATLRTAPGTRLTNLLPGPWSG